MNLFYLTQDINFQKALLLVAIIALILAILVSAYKLNSSVVSIAGQSWPPVVAPCPDYWDLSGVNCINLSGQNLGNDKARSIPVSAFGVNKKNWAKQYGVVWDGLTSG
jgi:hypothetical protein